MSPHQERIPWMVIEGALLVPLGLAAMLMPFMAGLAAALVFGWILILSGMVGLISAFVGRAHAHFGWSLVSALIALTIGLVLFLFPLAGAVALTLLIGGYLFLDGVTMIGLALDHRRRQRGRWRWMLASGVVDVLLAAAIVSMSAIGSGALIGLGVGLSLVLAGVALLAVHRPRARA